MVQGAEARDEVVQGTMESMLAPAAPQFDEFQRAVALIVKHGFSLTMNEAQDVGECYGHQPSSVWQIMRGNAMRRTMLSDYDVEFMTERQRGLLIFRDGNTERRKRDIKVTDRQIDAVRRNANDQRLASYERNKSSRYRK